MRPLILILADFYKKDFHRGIYLYSLVFVLVCIWINYRLNFEIKILDPLQGSFPGLFLSLLVYSIAYFSIAIPIILVHRKNFVFLNFEFWIKIAIILMIISVDRIFGNRHLIPETIKDPNKIYYLRSVLPNIFSIGICVLPVIFLWLIYDRNMGGFYGINFKTLTLKPFRLLFLILLIIVIVGVLLPGFTRIYPVYNYWNAINVYHLGKVNMGIIFLITYGFSFLAIELIFRGGLVLGFMDILGKEAVLPMAVLYVFIHFGKPMPEALSSLFGGYILGVFALHFKNILPGAFLHISLAFAMELAASIRIFWF
jgi:hypothetical protein